MRRGPEISGPRRISPLRDPRPSLTFVAMSRLRDVFIGLLVLATVFVIAQGAVGYFHVPRRSPLHWIVPGAAVIAVLVWYFRPTEDWTAGKRPDTPRDDRRGDPRA